MKIGYKVCIAFLSALLVILAVPATVYARIGDMGFFGGISHGRRLPHTTQQMILQQGNGRNTRGTTVHHNYQELVFLEGRPVQFDGIMAITNNAPTFITNGTTLRNMDVPTSGMFTKRYVVEPFITPIINDPMGVLGDPVNEEDVEVFIHRDIRFNVRFRVFDNQIIFYYEIVRNNWAETIITPEGTFILDNRRSQIGVTVIEDRTPGVNYYRGNVWMRLYYIGPGDELVIVTHDGEFHGFYSPWAATETHRTNVTVWHGDEWAISYQIRPNVTVNNIMRWAQNEPTAISFIGNFQEVMNTDAGIRFDIFDPVPPFMWDVPRSGTTSLWVPNTIEQLPAINVAFLESHAAQDDIHRLFAMEVLTGPPSNFRTGQAITRGQFMTALARAIRLPTADPPRPTRNRPYVTLFTDVDSLRPEFRYIEAIVREEVAFGRPDGSFHFDRGITRQEAIVTLIRALGLEHMAMYPTVVTPFLDTAAIDDWAMREMMVAYWIGLIVPDENGNITPNATLTTCQAAGLLIRFIEYMRSGLLLHYADQIVNITR